MTVLILVENYVTVTRAQIRSNTSGFEISIFYQNYQRFKVNLFEPMASDEHIVGGHCILPFLTFPAL